MVGLGELWDAQPVTIGEAAEPVAATDDIGPSRRRGIGRDRTPDAPVRLRPGYGAALVQRVVHRAACKEPDGNQRCSGSPEPRRTLV